MRRRTAQVTHIREMYEGGRVYPDEIRTYRDGSITVVTMMEENQESVKNGFYKKAALRRVAADLGEHFASYFEETDADMIRHRFLHDLQEDLTESETAGRYPLERSFHSLIVAFSGSRYFLVRIKDAQIDFLKADTKNAPEQEEPLYAIGSHHSLQAGCPRSGHRCA